MAKPLPGMKKKQGKGTLIDFQKLKLQERKSSAMSQTTDPKQQNKLEKFSTKYPIATSPELASPDYTASRFYNLLQAERIQTIQGPRIHQS